MWDKDHKIIVDSEEEIFKHLGLPYIPPNMRSYAQWRHNIPELAKYLEGRPWI
jgi:DNA polymerase/3'-5' exonuclease PolX